MVTAVGAGITIFRTNILPKVITAASCAIGITVIHFKSPDWPPSLWRHGMYLGHFGSCPVIRLHLAYLKEVWYDRR